MSDLESKPSAPVETSSGGAPDATMQSVDHAFEFRGNATEYFRIWIVNLALTIATVGIFSAWAKVRRERYFYGNTWLAGAPFEYLAKPLNILKGRVIAIVLFALYVLLGQFLPAANFVLIGVVLVALPWLVTSALRFRARYSAWNTLTFRFTGTLKEAFKSYLLVFALMPPTLGLIFPYARFRQRRFVIDGHRIGGHQLNFVGGASGFYAIYGKALLVFVALGIALGIAAYSALGRFASEPGLLDRPIGYWTSVGVAYGAMFFAWTFVAARVTNLAYCETAFGGHRFRSTVRARDLWAIYLTNTAAILLSLGMLVPWAQVRLARYRARHLVLRASSDLLDLAAEPSGERGAFGEEAASIFDVDISL